MSKGLIGGIAVGTVLVVGGIGVAMCTESVPAGHVGIVYSMNGGVQEETLPQGFHLVSPFKKVTKYSVGIEQGYLSRDSQEGSKGDDSFEIPTKDGKTINVDLEYSYHFDAEMLSETFSRFKGQSGNEIERTFIRGKLKAWAGEVSSTYSVIDIFGDKRTALNESMKEYVGNKFKEYGIVIDSVNFTRIETDEKTAEAIQQKVNAQQALELAKIESETATVNAEKEKEVAIIAAEKEKETAQLQADATLIKAQAEAQANKEIATSLTPELIEKMKYEKWNGQLPTVSGSGSGIIVDTTK